MRTVPNERKDHTYLQQSLCPHIRVVQPIRPLRDTWCRDCPIRCTAQCHSPHRETRHQFWKPVAALLAPCRFPCLENVTWFLFCFSVLHRFQQNMSRRGILRLEICPLLTFDFCCIFLAIWPNGGCICLRLVSCSHFCRVFHHPEIYTLAVWLVQQC